ncbi:hypothetical protein SD37_11660 [Amycolatopsis orientalis]|uniref:Uncharacterized protein n=1 Tax=Amycolatopsis orientalis TaxID=31958 RepID=A0A193BVN8_AMYOR|nr:hypothetical protein [Amycolatopsis orientalis]ANN16234.1 hypothetical protein SD37_11660 [Amycolatopsis orientalis]
MSDATIDIRYLLDSAQSRVTVLGPSGGEGYTRVEFEDGTIDAFPDHAIIRDAQYALEFVQKVPTEFDEWDEPRVFTRYFDDEAAAEAWLQSEAGQLYTSLRSYTARTQVPATGSDAVRSLEPAPLADRLGEALLALDAPEETPTAAEDDDPLDAVRELVTEAHDRLPADEFGGPLCKTCAAAEALVVFREVFADGYLAEGIVSGLGCREVEALIGVLNAEDRETWLRYHCTGDCDDLDVHGASEEDVALWRVMNEPPDEATPNR